MLKYKNPDNAFIVVANWMRNHSTISFLGLWEQIHNPNFKPIEFDRFKAESGDNAFTLTPQQWIATNSGKSTSALSILDKIIIANKKTLIIDPTGEYVDSFSDEEVKKLNLGIDTTIS